MERKLNMDTQMQNFWKESITKEELLRLCWVQRFQADPSKLPVRGREQKKLFALPHIDLSRLKESEQKKEEGSAEEAKQEEPKVGDGGEKVGTVSLSYMRPVTPKVRALLYDGFSKEEKGRHQYLKARTNKGPAEKYQFAITSSWDYGWKLGEWLSPARVGAGGERSGSVSLDKVRGVSITVRGSGWNTSFSRSASLFTDEDAEYKKPTFGRSAMIETAFYRRNGMFSKQAPNDSLD
ncbi:protein SPMIP1-like [Heptranchias perlo]|uniref:protein SPMIP1-like n=1 Tax=Heptranchias perlo TaxID=212740 RepID=UPI00355A932B